MENFGVNMDSECSLCVNHELKPSQIQQESAGIGKYQYQKQTDKLIVMK